MSEKRIADTGILLALVSLFVGYRIDPRFYLLSAAALLLVLFFPVVLKPLAYAWLKFGEVLGFFTNKLFFGLVFFLVITPVGFIRHMFFGPVKSYQFGSGMESAFINRSHPYEAGDLKHPY